MIVTRSRLLGAILSVVVLLTACSGPTGVADGDARFNGTWTYVASQAGSSIGVSGTLVLNGAGSGSIDGTLDAQQQEAGGPIVPLPGLVSGTVSASGMAQLQVTLAGSRVRTHYVQLRGDSLVGDWVEAGSSPSSGTFRAARRTP